MSDVTRQDVQQMLREAELAVLAELEPHDPDAEPAEESFSPLLTLLAAFVGAGLCVLGALLATVAYGAWTLAAAVVALVVGAVVVAAASVGGVYR